MKSVVLLLCVGVVLGLEPILLDYHAKVGIPEALRIKHAENATDFDGARILGGSEAKLGDHPHMGGLIITLTSGHTSMCGSSLLSNTRLVTAAHCWRTRSYQGRSVVVVLGSVRLFSGGTRISTSTVQLHSSYDFNNFNNDIAIIGIPRVEFNSNIRAIALPVGILEYFTYWKERAQAIGYGWTGDTDNSNDTLRQRNLFVISYKDCSRVYGPETVLDSTLCTSGDGGVGPCRGDSGSSLDWTFTGVRYLIGVMSFRSDRGCEAELPAGYVRVTSFLSWIRARI